MARKARVRMPPLKRVEPAPLPEREVVIEKLRNHPEVRMIREGGKKLARWHTLPLGGDVWVQWGKHAKPDGVGLTFGAINKVTVYPEPPEIGPTRSFAYSRWVTLDPEMPAASIAAMPKYGGTREFDRRDAVWVEGAGELAEEALDRQWRPTRTLKWEEMQALPDDLERAFDQLLTYLIQCQIIAADISGPWIRLIHNSFLEIKSYLAYELFDYNLAGGVLRKRLLSNGGGMGMQVDGFDAGVVEACNEASQGFEGEVERDFTGMVFALDVLFSGFVLDMVRLTAGGAKSSFDQRLLTKLLEDTARHVGWGTGRIRYYLEHTPDRETASLKLHGIAERLERAQLEGHLLNPKILEPLAVLLGGGSNRVAEGFTILRDFWPQFAENYLNRLEAVGLPRRGRCLIPSQAPF